MPRQSGDDTPRLPRQFGDDIPRLPRQFGDIPRLPRQSADCLGNLGFPDCLRQSADCLDSQIAWHNLQFNATSPTRIALRSPPSTLDLLLLSDSPTPSTTVIDIPYSDHSLVLTSLKLTGGRVPKRTVKSRNIKAININAFRNDLAQVCWNNADPTDTSLDEAWDSWTNKFVSVMDKHAPVRNRVLRRRNSVPWMDANLLRLIARRNRLHRNFVRNNRDENSYLAFKAARSEAHAYNRHAKSLYFQTLCSVYAGNSKQLWNVINTVTCRKRTNTDPVCSASSIGQAFANIVTDPARPVNLPLPPDEPSTPFRFSSFLPTTEDHVAHLLSRLPDCKAQGSDGIPGYLLSRAADILSPSVTELFNKSLASGVVPQGMKIANITPLYKGGDRSIATNYRPVSLLPILSKVLERIVHEQISSYLVQHDILPDTQFAYRKNFSTEDALLIASDRILQQKDRKQFGAACFIDLSKAFDKVKHTTLLTDLHDIGITGVPLAWFQSYLSNRWQRVVAGLDRSDCSKVSSGVPQGSVLGPVLFSLYVRNLRQCVQERVSVLQFADDIMLYCSNENPSAVEHDLTAATSSLADWLKLRGLILNERKSQVLCFPRTREESHSGASGIINVRCNGVPMPTVTSAKYLGITFDSCMSWRSHVQQKCIAVSRSIGALRRARNCLTVKARFYFYKSVIMSNLLYGSNSFIANLPPSGADKLIKLQKKALRSIFGLPNWAHTSSLFLMFQELNVIDTMLQKLAICTWRAVNSKCGLLISNLFSPRTGSRTRGSASNSLVLPNAQSLPGLHRPSFVGVVTWNALPAAARTSTTLATFKELLPFSMPKF